MRVLIYGSLHHKNIQGIKQILNYLNYEYVFSNNLQNIQSYDIVYSPSLPIKGVYQNIKFIYGPHFSVFPDQKLKQIQKGQNAVYIQPSDWARDAWGKQHIPLYTFSFPVDTVRFSPQQSSQRDTVFVYTKRRNPLDINFVCDFLKQKNINFVLFDYIQRYQEEEYLKILKQSKYGIIIDAHESQGFAIEEALSCNVPLLVWNVKTMNQEWRSRYGPVPCTTVPYWDERCGHLCYDQHEFQDAFEVFQNNLNNYNPRNYILENLSTEPCAKRFQELIKYIN